ncbi:MAG: hypothetical protein WCR51_08885 [Planctomycetia bacterium]
MAKKITGVTRLQIPAGTAADGPLVRRLLGPKGVNAAAFSSAFDAATAEDGRRLIPVVITAYEDRSFSFVINEPGTAPAHSQSCQPTDAF